LLITAVAATQVATQVISVISVIWHERTRAASHCVQIEAVAACGAMLYERLDDGSVLLIAANSAGSGDAAAAAVEWAISSAFHDRPAS